MVTCVVELAPDASWAVYVKTSVRVSELVRSDWTDKLLLSTTYEKEPSDAMLIEP